MDARRIRLPHLNSLSPKLGWSNARIAGPFTLIYLLLWLCMLSGCTESQRTRTSLEIATAIADKVIEGTTFEFESVPQEGVLGVEVVDFRRMFVTAGPGVGYALSNVMSDHDTTITFGVSASDGIKLWLNDKLVYSWNRPRSAHLVEAAYDRFIFQDTLRVKLHAGSNPILMKVATQSDPWICFLRPITPEGDWERSITFTLVPITTEVGWAPWLGLGPFPLVRGSSISDALDQAHEVEEAFLAGDIHRENWERFRWRIPEQTFLWELTSDYKRWAYNDWHYAHGATMLGILTLADATWNSEYRSFVEHYCDFILKHYDYFQWQYESLHALRGSYHKIYRRTMLDDTGAPALPFVELFLTGKADSYSDIVFPVADYITNDQARLKDGTFCRPEPVSFTVWADDLFMSVPYLLRMGRLTGNTAYFDDAAKQVIQFTDLLFVVENGLYKHGWFQPTGERSIAFWGRANGWIAWATSEALTHLPENHPQYNHVLGLFRRHMAGLATYQDETSGMWHQVLDHPESFEETSCTSMYVLSMARGVRMGWLDKKYREIALKGWEGISRQVEKDGTVHNICRGTGIGYNLQFYFDRPTFDHDPRGLGSIIIAGIEIDRLMRPDANDDSSTDLRHSRQRVLQHW